MGIRKYKPTTPGRRNYSVNTFTELTGDQPEKSLMAPLKKSGGRNNTGRITSRRRGGGHKRAYRLVDFKRLDKIGMEWTIKTVEYDPNRSAFIALVTYSNGARIYILAYRGIQVWDTIIVDEKAPLKEGNRMKLKNIQTTFKLYNIELVPGKGWQMVRSAGSYATLMSLDAEMAQIKLASWEIRYISKESYATIGQVSNEDHSLVRIGKAGRNRWLGKRPRVLGKSMGVHDHPHGGWEWHSPIGMKAPKTPWGACALGKKTRRKKNLSNKYIISRKKKK